MANERENVGPGRALRYLTTVLLLAFSATTASGQVAAHIAAGDRASLALRPLDALDAYERAIAADSAAGEAYWKAANMLLESAEYESDQAVRRDRFARAEQMARAAAALLPNDADARFVLGRAAGRAAMELGPRDRLRAAGEIRREAEAALALHPQHDGALHLLGRWHAEVMRLGATTRFMARRLLGGGDAIRGATWDDAQRLLEQAVAIAPQQLTHRLALAEIYMDRGLRDAAREQLQAVADTPAIAFNDAHYKRRAATLMSRLR